MRVCDHSIRYYQMNIISGYAPMVRGLQLGSDENKPYTLLVAALRPCACCYVTGLHILNIFCGHYQVIVLWVYMP